MLWVVMAFAVLEPKPRVVAPCGAGMPSSKARALQEQNRSVLLVVQTATGSRNNVCEGVRFDWREGLGQCLYQLSGVRVVAQNFDGTCADCGTLTRTSCRVDNPGMILLIGGAEDASKQLRYVCTGTYCRRTGKEFELGKYGLGHPPHDYVGGCDVHAYDNSGPIFQRVNTSLEPPTTVAWFPLLNPTVEMRVVWEMSSLYAGGPNGHPPLQRRNPKKFFNKPRSAQKLLTDYAYLKQVIEPAFSKSGRARIDVIRDDAVAKPLLLPHNERDIFKAARSQAHVPREPRLLYVGHLRPVKGQLSFLRKLRKESLGPFSLLLQGSKGEDYDAILAELPRFEGRVQVGDARLPHENMLEIMATSSGLVHYSAGDRNPRVLYEALYFGLPVFVSIQSMPYIGLQCSSFVKLTDVDHDDHALNADFARWVRVLAQDRRRKTLFKPKNNTLQHHVYAFVDKELTPRRVYRTLCERFSLCEPTDDDDPRTPWVSRTSLCGVARRLWRFEPWLRLKWNASRRVKGWLNISSGPDCQLNTSRRNCQDDCMALNKHDRITIDRPLPWWMPTNNVTNATADADCKPTRLRWAARHGLGAKGRQRWAHARRDIDADNILPRNPNQLLPPKCLQGYSPIT